MTLPPEPEPIMEAANNEQQQKFCFVEEIPEAEEKPTKGFYYFVDPSANEKWHSGYNSQRRAHVQRTYWRNRTHASEKSAATSLGKGLLVTADRQRAMESLSCSMYDTLCEPGYGGLRVATIANLIETFLEAEDHPLKIKPVCLLSHVDWFTSNIVHDRTAVFSLMSYCELVHQRHRFVTNPNIDSREVRWMSNKIRAIEGLQLKVRHNLQYSPSMVFTIACLAAIEDLEKNVDAAHVHLNALKVVVESRGGLRDFPSGIRDIIHWKKAYGKYFVPKVDGTKTK